MYLADIEDDCDIEDSLPESPSVEDEGMESAMMSVSKREFARLVASVKHAEAKVARTEDALNRAWRI